MERGKLCSQSSTDQLLLCTLCNKPEGREGGGAWEPEGREGEGAWEPEGREGGGAWEQVYCTCLQGEEVAIAMARGSHLDVAC